MVVGAGCWVLNAIGSRNDVNAKKVVEVKVEVEVEVKVEAVADE